ncbi:hypothetical protein I547_2050 [Mycobacterium kansasii 824]|uniref:Uncharacterized protein n=1 Tax=Mycobacterium kansasii TaxID=1768 RepID=A0A1V3WPL9_MYCKA|nr:hypothetical protein I547_2050 [Mycobacterium kansasii 824]OOK68708.1 hypothetical protein BZL30_7072 [Mycobacterium kansasii]
MPDEQHAALSDYSNYLWNSRYGGRGSRKGHTGTRLVHHRHRTGQRREPTGPQHHDRPQTRGTLAAYPQRNSALA